MFALERFPFCSQIFVDTVEKQQVHIKQINVFKYLYSHLYLEPNREGTGWKRGAPNWGEGHFGPTLLRPNHKHYQKLVIRPFPGKLHDLNNLFPYFHLQITCFQYLFS